MNRLKVVIYGSKGRMGQALIAAAKDIPALELVGTIDTGESLEAIAGCDALIDFTHADATLPALKKCVELGKIIVIGTTGHSNDVRQAITEASAKIPVIFSPNYSVGVNTLFWLTKKAAEILGPDYDAEVIEVHHRLKKDAPSGTARRLVEVLDEAYNLDYEKDTRHGRSGMTGERTQNEIGVHAVRGGDVVGDHTVLLAAPGDRLELIHRASSRETFARGALRAALWARDTKQNQSGLYDMQDVLGLR
ncbi:MAG: 4-hydroxy-tetrahydrodipicolinate reductase [Verrucomicrobia bacterium]|nr:4-hydroxy-tetrahydrodipicolinate reductase [Verrucomicrobiota bacterium]